MLFHIGTKIFDVEVVVEYLHVLHCCYTAVERVAAINSIIPSYVIWDYCVTTGLLKFWVCNLMLLKKIRIVSKEWIPVLRSCESTGCMLYSFFTLAMYFHHIIPDTVFFFSWKLTKMKFFFNFSLRTCFALFSPMVSARITRLLDAW